MAVWRKENWQSVKSQLPEGARFADVHKKAGELWQAMSPEEKSPYEAQWREKQEVYLAATGRRPPAAASPVEDAGCVHNVLVEATSLAAPSTAAGVSLDHVLRALPDFGGRLAELLWEVTGEVQELTFGQKEYGTLRIMRRRPEPAIPALLSANREIQLLAIIGIKERRVVSLSQDTHPQLSRSYAMMCDSLNRACPEAWAESRKMRMCPTEHADMMAAQQLMAAYGIPGTTDETVGACGDGADID